MTDPVALIRAAATAACLLGSFVPRPLPERHRRAPVSRPAAHAAGQVRRAVVPGRQRGR